MFGRATPILFRGDVSDIARAMAMPRIDSGAKAFEILDVDDEPQIRELLGAYDYLTKRFSLRQIDVLIARVEDRFGARGREPHAVAAN